MLWLDTYFEWIGPDSKCCGISNKGEFCLHPVNTTNSTCMPCVTASSLNQYGWPNADDFGKYLKWFLMDNPGTRCPSGGHAAFAGGVKLNHDNKTVNSKLLELSVKYPSVGYVVSIDHRLNRLRMCTHVRSLYHLCLD